MRINIDEEIFISDYDGTFFIDDKNIKYNIEKVKEFNHNATLLDKNHSLIRNYPIYNKAKQDIKNEFNLVDDQKYLFANVLKVEQV